MKRIQRLPLTSPSLAFLLKRTQKVIGASDARAEAKRLWEMRDSQAFREIREVLGQMATGIERCMYCEDSEGTAIEHFWPRAVYPDRAFDWLNYLIACSRCNSNFKRDQFPLDGGGQPLLVNPTEEDPLDHLAFSPATGRYAARPRSAKGDPSLEVFGINRATLSRGRLNAWTGLSQLLIGYARARRTGNDEKAERIEKTVREYPFAGVLAALLRIAVGPDADLLVDAECLEAIRDCPEIGGWG
ncbi:MAG TPA: HNH endonuclease [Thermoanaerobaculia bacterium]|nr:HNH endonuclease [Thermoanaerobaculia bacterium]